MSYSIQYGPVKPPKANRKQQTNVLVLMAVVLVPTLVLTAWMHPEKATQVKDTLFPWEQEYVQEAFSDFSDSIRSGDSFKDAVTELYIQILDTDESTQ